MIGSSSGLAYSFHLSTSSDFTDAVAVSSGLAAGAGTGTGDPADVTAWTVERTLDDGATYHWRAKASDGTFESAFLTGQFTVDAKALHYPGDLTDDMKVNFGDFIKFVSSFNKKAQELYERLGYETVGELKDYIVPGHSEILLRRTIAPITEFKRTS